MTESRQQRGWSRLRIFSVFVALVMGILAISILLQPPDLTTDEAIQKIKLAHPKRDIAPIRARNPASLDGHASEEFSNTNATNVTPATSDATQWLPDELNGYMLLRCYQPKQTSPQELDVFDVIDKVCRHFTNVSSISSDAPGQLILSAIEIDALRKFLDDNSDYFIKASQSLNMNWQNKRAQFLAVPGNSPIDMGPYLKFARSEISPIYALRAGAFICKAYIQITDEQHLAAIDTLSLGENFAFKYLGADYMDLGFLMTGFDIFEDISAAKFNMVSSMMPLAVTGRYETGYNSIPSLPELSELMAQATMNGSIFALNTYCRGNQIYDGGKDFFNVLSDRLRSDARIRNLALNRRQWSEDVAAFIQKHANLGQAKTPLDMMQLIKANEVDGSNLSRKMQEKNKVIIDSVRRKELELNVIQKIISDVAGLEEVNIKNFCGIDRYIVAKYMRSATSSCATQVIMACLRFKSVHGQLPMSLQELAPEFLGTVPTNPCTGEPIIYLRDKKQLLFENCVWPLSFLRKDCHFPIEQD